MVVLGCGWSVVRQSDARTERFVRSHRPAIMRAGEAFDVDPRLLASLMFVSRQGIELPLRGLRERVAVGGETAGYVPPTLSVGPMRLRLDTVVGALAVETECGHKDVTEASPAGIDCARVSNLARLHQTPRDSVDVILDEDRNIQAAALVLALYQLQWEAANPLWSIRDRPDIVATLYRLGVHRSHPHANPQPNEFGRRVLEAYRRPWIQEAFLAESGRSSRE
ncbi:MAG: hypothetical protein U0Q12_14385 [Vicinamibacterales bacterium]